MGIKSYILKSIKLVTIFSLVSLAEHECLTKMYENLLNKFLNDLLSASS